MRVAQLSDYRILIVDDQTANLNVLATVLESAGYLNVRCLSDSREVLNAFAEFAPDLLLLDLHMPHLSGLEVMEQLGPVIGPDDYVPILVLTGDGTSEAKGKALSHGANDFLSKPLNQTEVKLRVRNLLQTRGLHLQLKEKNVSLARQVQERTELAEQLAETNGALEETNRRLKEAQAHLVQSEKMASLGQLVAGIAHEINNPLAFVINNLFVVQEGLDRLMAERPPLVSAEGTPRMEKARARLRDMHEGTERVKELVTKLRTFSRLDEGKFKTVQIHESIESVLLLLRHRLEDRIQVERNFGGPDHLACYAGELNQVLMNLVANAIDSIEGPGRITISTEQQNGHFVFRVRDTGKGISEQIREKVFDPFFTTKPIGQGTGLGLAISYGVVKAHGGAIDFRSKEGEGTEFVVKIPVSLEVGG